MSRLPLAVLVLVLVLPATLQGADFRQSDWGDSVEDVRAVETATFHHLGEGELAYEDDSVEGIRGGIIYLFELGALVRAVYVSRNEYEGGDGALADYERLQEHFAGLFSEAGERDERWVDESLRGEPGRFVEAILLQDVRVATRWSLEHTHVELVMTGREGGVYMRASFQPHS